MLRFRHPGCRQTSRSRLKAPDARLGRNHAGYHPEEVKASAKNGFTGEGDSGHGRVSGRKHTLRARWLSPFGRALERRLCLDWLRGRYASHRAGRWCCRGCWLNPRECARTAGSYPSFWPRGWPAISSSQRWRGTRGRPFRDDNSGPGARGSSAALSCCWPWPWWCMQWDGRGGDVLFKQAPAVNWCRLASDVRELWRWAF